MCGEEDWHSEKDGRDGFPIIGEVPIAREDILEPVTFWFNQGPKDHPYHNETKVRSDLSFRLNAADIASVL